MPRVAVIGDLHLGKLSHRIEGHLQLQLATIDTILAQVREHGLKTVVLLGDVFDKPNVSASIVISVIKLFLVNKDLTFHWIIGNHDKTSKAEATADVLKELATLQALPNVHIYDQPTAVKGVGFLPYPHKKPIKGTVLSFAHIERPGVKMDSGRVYESKEKWNEKHTFVIGHIHTPQKVGKSTYYTGSPYQLSAGESVEGKHWAIVSYDSKDASVFSYSEVPIVPKYKIVNVKVKSDKFFKRFKPEPAPTYYKLHIENHVRVPPGFLMDNENCEISIKGSRILDTDSKVKIAAKSEIKVTMTYRLEEYLRNKKGLNDQEVAEALKLARRKVEHLEVSNVS